MKANQSNFFASKIIGIQCINKKWLSGDQWGLFWSCDLRSSTILIRILDIKPEELGTKPGKPESGCSGSFW